MDESAEIDIEAPMGCVGMRVRRTGRALTSFYNQRIRAAGIRITQWPILSALRVAGALTLGDLAGATGTDQSTISRNIQPLVRDGLVDLTEEDDGRKRYARLTPKGLETFNHAYRLWKDAQDEVLELLGDEWESIREKLVDLEAAVR